MAALAASPESTTPTTLTTRASTEALGLDALGRDVGLLVVRGGVGLLLAAHGAQKFFGWWGAPDFDGVAAGFAQLGYSPGRFFAFLASASELVGGLLLVLGLLTPLACAAAIGVMFNVVVGVTWSNGVFGPTGYEVPLLLGTVAVAVAFTGPGRFALDRGWRWGNGGLVPGLASVGLGVAGALLVLAVKWT